MTSPASLTPSGIIARGAARTDRGLTRQNNEDALAVASLSRDEDISDLRSFACALEERGALFVVADGMGGGDDGEIASRMAVDIVVSEMRTRWSRSNDRGSEAFARALKSSLEEANAQIHSHATSSSKYRPMGTTATAVAVLGDRAFVGQIGDSRAYLVRGGTAHQVTKDQSLVQQLVDAGTLTPDEAAVSHQRNVIMQALGPTATVQVALTHQQLRQGDALVLCSDGLTGVTTADEIAQEVGGTADPAAACDHLIGQANERGGPDNITVIVVYVDGPGLQPGEQGDRAGEQPFALD